MLITLETGRRDLHRIGVEHAANPQRAMRNFRDAAAAAMSERHHQEFFHAQAEESTRRHLVEFSAYQQIGVAIMAPRALMADFS